MKRFISLFCACLMANAQSLDEPSYVASLTAAAAGASCPPNTVGNCTTCLIAEGFEEVDSGGGLGTGTDGYDSANVNEEGGTVANNDYNTSPAPLDGCYSCYFATATTGGYVRVALPGNYQEYWVYATAYNPYGSATGAFVRNIGLIDNAANDQATVYLLTNGHLRLHSTRDDKDTAGFMVVNGQLHYWLHWQRTTPTAANMEFGYTNNTTRPTGGNNYVSSTLAGTNQVDRLEFGIAASGTGMNFIFDKVLVSTNGWPTL